MTAPDLYVTISTRTDPGMTRDHNEDTFLVANLSTGRTHVDSVAVTEPVGERGHLFLVADGMGGAAAGELASSMAADLIFGHLSQVWAHDAEQTPERFTFLLKEAVSLANLQINTYAGAHPEFRGMGTTATVAGVLGNLLYVAQVGDSRAYLVRDGEAVQLTKDQSLTQRLVDAGEMTEEQAERSERRNIILQALGPDPHIRVELTWHELRQGDTLVLCSDGLSGQVRREEIARAVTVDTTELGGVTEALIATANERGGPDNITVVVARFEGAALSGPPESAVAYQILNAEASTTESTHEHLAAPRPKAPPPQRRTGSPLTIAAAGVVFLGLLVLIFLLLTG